MDHPMTEEAARGWAAVVEEELPSLTGERQAHGTAALTKMRVLASGKALSGQREAVSRDAIRSVSLAFPDGLKAGGALWTP